MQTIYKGLAEFCSLIYVVGVGTILQPDLVGVGTIVQTDVIGVGTIFQPNLVRVGKILQTNLEGLPQSWTLI